ncbi:MAG: MotA/TolQ/ExbB proton channel family protein [Elusimicrobiota bacterium]
MPTTIFGILLGMTIMVYAIIKVTQQDPSAVNSVIDIYLNLPAFLIVAGGILSATLIAHPLSHLFRGIKAFFIVFTRPEFNFVNIIESICEFSQSYTQQGIPGIEEKLKSYKKQNLITDGMNMLINGYNLEEIKEFLETSTTRKYDTEMIDYYVFRTMARSAPAFGMVGTLVGLIFMLTIMGDDPSKIGPFLAVALVTTFYGLIMANLIFSPMGNKLQHHAELNFRINRMEIEGIMFILKKQHPLYIKDELSGYLPPKQRKKLFKEKKAKPGK